MVSASSAVTWRCPICLSKKAGKLNSKLSTLTIRATTAMTIRGSNAPVLPRGVSGSSGGVGGVSAGDEPSVLEGGVGLSLSKVSAIQCFCSCFGGKVKTMPLT